VMRLTRVADNRGYACGVGGFGGFWAIAFPIAQGLEKICIHYKYRIYIEIIALTR